MLATVAFEEFKLRNRVVDARNVILNVAYAIRDSVFHPDDVYILVLYRSSVKDACHAIKHAYEHHPSWFSPDECVPLMTYGEYLSGILLCSPGNLTIRASGASPVESNHDKWRVSVLVYPDWLVQQGLPNTASRPFKFIRELKKVEKVSHRGLLNDGSSGVADPARARSSEEQMECLARRNPELRLDASYEYFQLIQHSDAWVRTSITNTRYDAELSSHLVSIWAMVYRDVPWTRRRHNAAYQLGSLLRLVKPEVATTLDPVLDRYDITKLRTRDKDKEAREQPSGTPSASC